MIIDSDLIPLLIEFLDLGDLCVQQYVFAMVGDLQKYLGECFKDKLPEFITRAIKNLYH